MEWIQLSREWQKGGKKMNEEIEGPGFTIKDARSSKKPEKEIEEEKSAKKTSDSLPKLEFDFSTFVLSLTSSAFYHLGDVADPHTDEKTVNLPAVKQTIDILIMLQGKTKGNLNNDEAKLIEQLIYELQMRYLEKNK